MAGKGCESQVVSGCLMMLFSFCDFNFCSLSFYLFNFSYLFRLPFCAQHEGVPSELEPLAVPLQFPCSSLGVPMGPFKGVPLGLEFSDRLTARPFAFNQQWELRKDCVSHPPAASVCYEPPNGRAFQNQNQYLPIKLKQGAHAKPEEQS